MQAPLPRRTGARRRCAGIPCKGPMHSRPAPPAPVTFPMRAQVKHPSQVQVQAMFPLQAQAMFPLQAQAMFPLQAQVKYPLQAEPGFASRPCRYSSNRRAAACSPFRRSGIGRSRVLLRGFCSRVTH